MKSIFKTLFIGMLVLSICALSVPCLTQVAGQKLARGNEGIKRT